MAIGVGTLLDLSKSERDGATVNTIHTIIDNMPLLDQMHWAPCNNGTFNKTQIITDYPEGQSRGYNEGVISEKAGSIWVTDSTGWIASSCQIDEKLLEDHGNSAEWRNDQEQRFKRGLAKRAAEMIFNSSLKADPKTFDGLCVRYGKTGGDYSDVVLDAGGKTGVLEDIWIVNWGADTVHGIYPEGDTAGLQVRDRGIVPVLDANGKRFFAAVTDFDWRLGLAVEDRRQVVRVANIDMNALSAKVEGGNDLIDMLIDAVEMFPSALGNGAAIYMSANMRTMLRKQIGHRENVNLQWETVAGRKVVTYDGIPVHKIPNNILKSYNKALPTA